jgi:hypothetical protein
MRFKDRQIRALAEALRIDSFAALEILHRELAAQVERDHRNALLDELACALCGERELQPRHGVIGQAPSETPEYVRTTRGMMNDPANDPVDIIGMDHASALVEYRQVLAERRLSGR